MLIRVAITLDYPQLRKIYFESHRQSFHWLNTEEMHLHDLDRNTLEEQIYLAEILRFISLYVLNCFIRLFLYIQKPAGQGAGKQLQKKNLGQNTGSLFMKKCNFIYYYLHGSSIGAFLRFIFGVE
ncbi:GNAT family N-acetyltransferase [Bacillus altitudinis]|uniref:GNAT family N-acetyltransferase n=1 Tax=Bacillus altitudinis TaxID=293387 RepID=UPI003B519AE2